MENEDIAIAKPSWSSSSSSLSMDSDPLTTPQSRVLLGLGGEAHRGRPGAALATLRIGWFISFGDPSGNSCPRNLCLLQRDLQVREDSHRSRQSSLLWRQKRAASSPKVGIPGTSRLPCNRETRCRRRSFVPRLAMPHEPSKRVSL